MSSALRSIPPAPGRLPLLGHTGVVLRHWRDPFAYLTSLAHAGPVLRLDVPTLPMVLLTSPDDVRAILRDPTVEKGRLYDRMQGLVGREGLGTAPNAISKHRRVAIKGVTGRGAVAQQIRIMSRRAEQLAASWQPGQTLDAQQALSGLAVDTLADTMFSARLGRAARDTVRETVPEVMKAMIPRAIIPPALDRLPIRPNRTFEHASARLRAAIADAILAQEALDTPGEGSDLLTLLAAARHPETGEPLTREQILDELATILFAGADTAPSIAAWALYHIATNPDVEAMLQAEIDQVVGTDPVTFDHLPRLPYLRSVIQETMRLHGVTFVDRRTTRATDVSGHRLPAGTQIAISFYALGRHPGLYRDPDTFQPGRDIPHPELLMPWGSGLRRCPGEHYATAEITAWLCAILSRWRLTIKKPFEPRAVFAGMPRPERLPIIVTLRHEPKNWAVFTREGSAPVAQDLTPARATAAVRQQQNAGHHRAYALDPDGNTIA